MVNAPRSHGRTDLLEDLVGMMDGDVNPMGNMQIINQVNLHKGDDDEIEIGSDYPYA